MSDSIIAVPEPLVTADFDDILATLNFGGMNAEVEKRRFDVARLLSAGTAAHQVVDLLNQKRPADAQLTAQTVWDDIDAVLGTWRQQQRLSEGDVMARLLAYHWNSMAQLSSDIETEGDAGKRAGSVRAMVETSKEISRLMGIPSPRGGGAARAEVIVVEGKLGRALPERVIDDAAG